MYGNYYKNLFLYDKCIEYQAIYNENEINTGEGSVNDDNIECIKTEDVNLALLIYSTGEEHPYGIPYRLFWDYDHETIFSGTAKDEKEIPVVDGLWKIPEHPRRGSWDKFISQDKIVTKNTEDYTLFNNHRLDYIKGALQIRFNNDEELDSSKYLNPLKYEPVFLVLEKDLLDVATNNDIDEDKLPDKWEQENGLDWNNPNDANEDSDNDGLTNLPEYQMEQTHKIKIVMEMDLVMVMRFAQGNLSYGRMVFPIINTGTLELIFRECLIMGSLYFFK